MLSLRAGNPALPYPYALTRGARVTHAYCTRQRATGMARATPALLWLKLSQQRMRGSAQTLAPPRRYSEHSECRRGYGQAHDTQRN